MLCLGDTAVPPVLCLPLFPPHIVPGHRSSRGHFRSPRGVLPGLGMTCATGTLRALSGQPPSSGFILELLSSPSRPPPSPLAPSSVPKALLTSSLLSSSPRYLGHPPLPLPQIIASWVEARGSNLAGSTCAATPAPGKALPPRTSPCLSHLLLLLRSLKPTRFLGSFVGKAGELAGLQAEEFCPRLGHRARDAPCSEGCLLSEEKPWKMLWGILFLDEG